MADYVEKKHKAAGVGNPEATPDSHGQHYLDLVTGRTWISRGVSNAADWGGHLLSRNEIPAASAVEPRKIFLDEETDPTTDDKFATVDFTQLNSGDAVVINNACRIVLSNEQAISAGFEFTILYIGMDGCMPVLEGAGFLPIRYQQDHLSFVIENRMVRLYYQGPREGIVSPTELPPEWGWYCGVYPELIAQTVA